jgi:hypothetical protein
LRRDGVRILGAQHPVEDLQVLGDAPGVADVAGGGEDDLPSLAFSASITWSTALL